jgi:hypothetical protein
MNIQERSSDSFSPPSHAAPEARHRRVPSRHQAARRAQPQACPGAQQPSREFASTDPTTRTQDAGFQESGFSPKISLNPRSRLQHFQRPTPSHLRKNAPSLQGHGRGATSSLRREPNMPADLLRALFGNVTVPGRLRLTTCTIGFAFNTESELGLTIGRADAAGIPTAQTKITART